MNTGIKILNKVLANIIQEYINGIIYMNKWGLFQGGKAGSIFENQGNPPLSTGYRRETTQSYQLM